MLEAVAAEYPANDGYASADVDEFGPDELDGDDRQRSLVGKRQRDASIAKAGFARYCFFAVNVASAAAIAIFHYLNANPYVGTAALAILPIVLVTARMGTYSFAVAHRHVGYELHLARTRNVPTALAGRWRNEYRRIGWEEAMRAWRSVEPTLYEKILTPSHLWNPSRYRWGCRPTPSNPRWYSQQSLFGKYASAKWYPGSYLLTMLFILYAVASLAIALMWITPFVLVRRFQLDKDVTPPFYLSAWDWRSIWSFACVHPWQNAALGLTILAAAGATGFTVCRFRVDMATRRNLEDGLLSIHSRALIWQAVIIAHFRAVEHSRAYRLSAQQLSQITRTAKANERTLLSNGQGEEVIKQRVSTGKYRPQPDGAGLPGYGFWIGQEAASIAQCAKDIHGWIAFGADGCDRR